MCGENNSEKEGVGTLERNAFYNGRRVLVTGHTGFKGTWLCWLLSALGAEPFGYALPPRPGCLYEMARPPMGDEIFGDVRNRTELERALDQFQPDLIVHLAAHAYLDGSYEYPADIFEINVMGTVGLLEAVRRSGRRVPTAVVTSDKCYAQGLKGKPCREGDPFGAAEAYSTSKACQDLTAQCYRISFPDMPIAAARASNTIGGGDFNKTRLIPHLLDCFSRGEPAKLRNPNFVRPWQYVLDVLWGYLTLGQALTEGAITGDTSFNFGPAPDGFQTVGRVAELLASHFPGADCEPGTGGRSGETELLRLDSGKARELLGWRPLYTLEETLAQAATFQKGLACTPAARLCREQTAQYIKRIQETRG